MVFGKKNIDKEINYLEDKVSIAYLETNLEPLKNKQENYRLFIEYFNHKKKIKGKLEESIIDLEVLDEQLRVYNKLSELYNKIGNKGRADVYEELAEKCEKDIKVGEVLNASFDEVNELFGQHLMTIATRRSNLDKWVVDGDAVSGSYLEKERLRKHQVSETIPYLISWFSV